MAMASASSQRSFLTNTVSPVYREKKQVLKPFLYLSCRSSVEEQKLEPSRNEMRVAKLAMVTLAAGILTLGSVHEAVAAKTGGRVGGQAFRSAAAPKASSPRINNSRTNVYINPPVAPPLIGGYGYGVPFYGGWGWSPFSFFAPGPSVAIGFGGGFEFFALLLFVSAVATVIRRFTRSNADDEDDY